MQLETFRIAPFVPVEDEHDDADNHEGDPSHENHDTDLETDLGPDEASEFLEDQLDNLLDQADAVEATEDATETTKEPPAPQPVDNSLAPLLEIPPDTLARIRSCHARVSACESRVDACKEDLKYAKAQHEEAVSSLMRAVGELNILGNPLPLFDQPAEPEPSTVETPAVEETTEETAPCSPPLSFAESDAWRSIPISDLGLTKPLAKRLADAGLSTVGKIADHTNAGKRLTDIPGIGEGKAEQIADALERLWAERANHGDHNEGDGDAEESE